MKITFGIGLDGNVWPDVLNTRDAALGEIAVGEHGLLGILETMTGLKGPEVTSIRRMIAYYTALQAAQTKSRFYDASFAKDSLAVASDLLRLRDELRLAGWDGKPITGVSRTVDLSDVESLFKNRTGVPDWLIPLERAIAGNSSLNIKRIRLVDRREALPMRWKSLLDVLESKGVAIDESGTESKKISDKNGELSLLQTSDPWTSANWIAAYLAQLPTEDLKRTVVVAPPRHSGILANAMKMRGVPFGAPTGEASLCRPSVQILVVIMFLAFVPPDPKLAKALLLLGNSPIWRRLANRLIRALDDQPAIGSDRWNRVVAETIDEWEKDPEEKKDAQTMNARLAWVFGTQAERGTGVTINQLEDKLSPAIEWLQNYGGARGAKSYLEAAAIGREFLSIAKMLGRSPLREDQCLRLFQEVAGDGAGVEMDPARAGGPVVVDGPEKVLSSAAQIIWWDFNVHAASRASVRSWLPMEISALKSAGVAVSEPKDVSGLHFSHWQRPIQAMQDGLIAVSFLTDPQGSPEAYHPVLDYVLPSDKDARSRVLAEMTITPMGTNAASERFRRMTGGKLAIVKTPELPAGTTAQVDWRITEGSLKERDSDSPSSLSKLLGCSLSYALQYYADLEAANAEGLSQDEQLAGNIAHAVFEKVFKIGVPPEPGEAKKVAESTFDKLIQTRAQELMLDQKQLDRMALRSTIAQAAQRYSEFLKSNRLEVIAVEAELQGELAKDIPIKGRVDCILGRAGRSELIIDYKWGGLSGRRDDLAQGRAHQLYTYAKIAGGKKPLGVGYFIMTKGQLLVADTEYQLATTIEGPSIETVLETLAKEIRTAKDRLSKGTLSAPGATLESSEAVEIDPPCQYCEYKGICGHRFNIPETRGRW